MFNVCVDYTYLSVNRVNVLIGENTYMHVSSQLRTEFHCVSPDHLLVCMCIQYHMFLSCDLTLKSLTECYGKEFLLSADKKQVDILVSAIRLLVTCTNGKGIGILYRGCDVVEMMFRVFMTVWQSN